MARSVILNAKNNSIVLEIINDLKWCKISIVSNDATSLMGAESLEIIKGKLMHTLKKYKSLEHKVQIYESNAFWVMSLEETHTCVYGEAKNNNLILYFIGDGKKLLNTVEISDIEKKCWLKILKDL